MEKIKLCLGCMEVLGDNKKVCHHCGYKVNSAHNDLYIAPGTVLNNERYTIGKVLKFNGESVLYIAYDNTMGCKVKIREYMPSNLCFRDKSSANIIINDKYCVQYKSLMAEFIDLNKSLVKLRNLGNITTVLDLFNANNTSYAVYEYTDGVTLSKYLKENMGELTWDETAKIFPQLLTTIGLLHQSGIIHRAISPETIYYTSRNELLLTDFSISAVRTKDTELSPELFKGYSAPEQYSISGKQGTWTDVYSISAILYKVLTGCMPTEAINRIDHDNLCAPIEINSDIPESVSNAIINGMSVNIDNRIQTITDLVTKLFQTVDKREEFSSTIQIPRRMLDDNQNKPTPSTERITKQETVEEEKVSFFDKIKFPLMIGILLLAIIFILGWVFINMFAPTSNETSNSLLEHRNGFVNDVNLNEDGDVIEVTSNSDNTKITLYYLMKNLIDKDIADVKSDTEIQDKVKFEVTFEYNDDYEKDRVFEQSIAVGQRYQEGETIKLKVSKGPRTIEVPDYKTSNMSTYTKDDYIKMLDSKNIPYELVAVINKSSKDGYVISTEPKAGEILNLEKGEVLKITYTNNKTSDYESDEDNNSEETKYSIKSTTKVTKKTETSKYDDNNDENQDDTKSEYTKKTEKTYVSSNDDDDTKYTTKYVEKNEDDYVQTKEPSSHDDSKSTNKDTSKEKDDSKSDSKNNTKNDNDKSSNDDNSKNDNNNDNNTDNGEEE